ncbi:MAG TPA: hypothetical protein VK084_00240 [Chitinophagaceae bacterium]|nr:hypothetical protein [Chitinophagaceae bacterium]
MQEYVRELQEKVGLSEEQAVKSVQVLFEKLKSKIPEPMQQMAENMFMNDSEEENSLQDKIQKFQQNLGKNND